MIAEAQALQQVTEPRPAGTNPGDLPPAAAARAEQDIEGEHALEQGGPREAGNGVGERCEVCDGDLRDVAVLAGEAPFDLVTGTPPYLPPGTASESRRPQRGPATIEHRGGIEAYCETAARVLAPEGRFVVCEGAAQVARVEAAAEASGLDIERRLDVVPRAGKAALFSVYVMARSVGSGTTAARRSATELVVRDAEGHRTTAFRGLRADMGMPA